MASKGALRTGLAGAGGVLVVAGALLTATGRDGLALVLGGVAGTLALGAGAMFFRWRIAAGLAAVSLLLTLALGQLVSGQAGLPIYALGLALLAAGGGIAATLFRGFANQLEKQRAELRTLNETLGQKHQAFVAATSDLNGTRPGDTAAITAAIAASVGADIACCYLISADGRRFVPQPPGVGVDRLRPQAVNRPHGNGGPLLSAVDGRKPFAAADESPLVELISFLPEDFHLRGLMAVPMPIGDHVGGFMVLGRTAAQFSDDDKRLAATLATRAGEQVASAQLVALTRQESARYSLMNELVKEASGKNMNEVLELVLGRGSEVVRYDTGRALMFHPDNTYVVLDGTTSAPEPIDGPLARVRDGETMLRNLVTEDEGIFSGLHPEHLGGTINEALTPIRSKSGVIGALCLGRRGNAGFTQQDLGALDDLGSMAGVAVENSRILQVVSGQASRLDVALDALGEVSAALTTVTQGSRVLEQKTLEAAIRIVDGTAGMLTRTNADGNQAAIMAVWLGADPTGMVFQNGQGVVGATMLSGRATVVSDLAWQSELASPPDLGDLKAAICTPMFEEGQLWGTLSVFDDKKREWTTDDQRVLATLANQGVVAVRNADLYEKNERSIWELRNLQEALQAATSTLDLNQVLQQVLAGAAKASSAQIGCLALADDNGKLVLKGGFGTDHLTAERLALGIGGDICHKVMKTGEPVMEAMSPKTHDDSALNPRAVLCVP
ncbi:MAG TPA: GAF domain-containing protein, partial [Candidatus Dormibacteraeota bacterium]|nr:GAF domain-containing protein [Candidatus Dormibacteraeota bacterium]